MTDSGGNKEALDAAEYLLQLVQARVILQISEGTPEEFHRRKLSQPL